MANVSGPPSSPTGVWEGGMTTSWMGARGWSQMNPGPGVGGTWDSRARW